MLGCAIFSPENHIGMKCKKRNMSDEASKRKTIPKSIRFEIFKRDKFTCQYCGKKSPNVILHVDRINPVSKGGTNDLLNLITSCEAYRFNFGK